MAKRVPHDGEVMTCWGQSFTWTSEHPTYEQTEPMLRTYDETAANAYNRAIELFNAEEALRKKEAGSAAGPPVKPDVFQIVKDNAATEAVCNKLWEQVNHVPHWVDWEQIDRGQKVFWRYAMANLVGLGYQSLFAGMAAARTIEVLVRTGGFAPAAAQRRGFETAQWILEIMKDVAALKPHGQGWESTVRVRLLHAAVRSKIWQMAKARPEYYNVEDFGIPINDFDQAGTMCTFSAAPIWFSLPAQKIHLREREIEDYIALWRYIAYLIGAPEQLFAVPSTAKAFQESALYYEIDPNENSKILAQNLLDAFKKQQGLPMPGGLVNAIARSLAGDDLCNELEVGKVNVLWRGVWKFNMSSYRNFAYLCRAVPWMDQKHINLMRSISWKLVVKSKYGLKGERTKFGLKYLPNYKLTKAE